MIFIFAFYITAAKNCMHYCADGQFWINKAFKKIFFEEPHAKLYLQKCVCFCWPKCLCPFALIQTRLFSKTIEAKKAQSTRDCPGSRGLSLSKRFSQKLLWLGRTTLSVALCITSKNFTLYPFWQKLQWSPFTLLWGIGSSVQLICFDYLPSVITTYCIPSPHLAMKKNI